MGPRTGTTNDMNEQTPSGGPETDNTITDTVRRMMNNEGFYIGSDPDNPEGGVAPIVSVGGKLYSMQIDEELDPTRFIPEHRLDGPFLPGGSGGLDWEPGDEEGEGGRDDEVILAAWDLHDDDDAPTMRIAAMAASTASDVLGRDITADDVILALERHGASR